MCNQNNSCCPCVEECNCPCQSAGEISSCCAPIDMVFEREYRRCTNPCGCTALYPADCRVNFWPNFAHPRWLCCEDLYSGQKIAPCGGNCRCHDCCHR